MDLFQHGVGRWMEGCFPPEVADDKVERCDRFIEEALELTQACYYDVARAHALVDYVFARPKGDHRQEVGGVMVTLAALCNTFAVDLDHEACRELARINDPDTMARIRAKQAAKPTGSALPIAQAACSAPGHTDLMVPPETIDDFIAKFPPPDLPVDLDGVRPQVAAFALRMEQELRANEHKGGWTGESPVRLAIRASQRAGGLLEEAEDYLEARRGLDPTYAGDIAVSVGHEAADLANYAMMVADVCGALSEARAAE